MADSFDVEYLLRKRHNILENIFEYLDNQSLTTCREVSNSWKNFIDKRNYPWTRIVDKYFPKEVDKIGIMIQYFKAYLSTQFPLAIGWKKSSSYNHKATIWVSH